MIYDCFTFFNELDLLEIRLNTLNDVVDRFVIAEATRTYSGKPKELLFEKNRERYAAFADKITYIVVDDLLPEEEISKDAFHLPWVNENRQRNALIQGLSAASDDDVLMVSDLDEIPRPEKIAEAVDLARRGEVVRFVMSVFSYYVNFKNYQTPWWYLGTQMMSMRTFHTNAQFDNFNYDRFTTASECQGRVIQKVRFLKPSKLIKDGGWHMGYLGGLAAIKAKLRAFSHCEALAVMDEVEQRLKRGVNIFGGKHDNFAVPLDDTFPSFLLAERNRFAHLIAPCDQEYVSRTRYARMRAYIRGAIYRRLVALVPKCLVGVLSQLRIRLHFR